MTQEEWEKYGGLDYATSADLASRSQQIAVAEKVLADRGTGAWATCGLVAGLDAELRLGRRRYGFGAGLAYAKPHSVHRSRPGPGLGVEFGRGLGIGRGLRFGADVK